MQNIRCYRPESPFFVYMKLYFYLAPPPASRIRLGTGDNEVSPSSEEDLFQYEEEQQCKIRKQNSA